MYAETIYQLLNELEQRLAQHNASRIYEVKKSIASLVKENNSVIVYFSKLKELFDELLNYVSVPKYTCGGLKSLIKHQEREWSMKFLMWLDESYINIKAQVLMMKPFPTLNEVYSIIQ